MQFWPFYWGGIALALAAILHWVIAGQLMSVSSRFTNIVDRMRRVPPQRPETAANHVGFFGGLALGGFLSVMLAGTFAPTVLNVGTSFTRFFSDRPTVVAGVLLVGGVLVGVGTRMATGCTSGHGLCGVARFERGSLLATAAFFGTGCATSFALSGVFL